MNQCYTYLLAQQKCGQTIAEKTLPSNLLKWLNLIRQTGLWEKCGIGESKIDLK